ncbi:MAG: thioredoxin family protein [Planctomycetia bacterium]|nr:thioredoxin family protein [Planctomycetia bacterium]
MPVCFFGRQRSVHASWLALLALLSLVAPAAAQINELNALLDGGRSAPGEKLTVSAQFAPGANGQPATLFVIAELQPGWHTYSVTQPKGGPIRTAIKLEESGEYKIAGEFAVDPPAESRAEPLFGGINVEEHHDKVVWFAPISFTPDVDLKNVVVKGSVRAQLCDAGSCLPPKDYAFEARLGDMIPVSGAPAEAPEPKPLRSPATQAPTVDALPPQLEETPDDYRASGSHVVWRGQIEPSVAAPGEVVNVQITAVPVESYHLYAYAAKDPRTPQSSKPTLVLLTDHPEWAIAGPGASAEPVEKASETSASPEKFYEEPIAWTFQLTVPADAPHGKLSLTGMVGYQACLGGENGVCDFPLAAQFNGMFEVAAATGKEAAPLRFTKGRSYTEVAKLADGDSEVEAAPPAPASRQEPSESGAPAVTQSESANLPFWSAIGFGFLGGLLLNLMPCVLPVIGLKVLAFVEQAGKDRGHVFALNAVYSLGIISVFALLAGLASLAGFGWGQQFSYASFNIVMTAVIFVMALSFLGVWEIPIPGFVGGSTASALARKEGWSGTFIKGVLTTILATPCSGPGLGTALAWTTGKPTLHVFGVFLSMGVGMASPYLLIGAFPSLLRFLPKPGAWMDTFKHMMGFVLVGTVAYMLTLLSPPLVIPTVTLLFGLWAACWWIGRVPYTATLGEKLKTWAQAAAFSAAIFIVAFVGWAKWTPEIVSFVGIKELMQEREEEDFRLKIAQGGGALEIRLVEDASAAIPWNPYTEKTLAELTSQGRPVMIDFTADWCQTCKAMEKFVLNTTAVREKLKELGVVPLQADMSDFPPEPSEWLNKYAGTEQIPVVAIYAPGQTTPAKVFVGGCTQSQVLEELNRLTPAEQRTAALPQ